jgi:hypothetical protein
MVRTEAGVLRELAARTRGDVLPNPELTDEHPEHGVMLVVADAPRDPPEWEQRNGMAFPESGDYWFPGGLATVAIDRAEDTGVYWEPNVWMEHTI